MSAPVTHLVFSGTRLVLEADLSAVALELHAMAPQARTGLVIFAIADGRVSDPAMASAAELPASAAPLAPRKRGRPRLGVVGREITLLPRHWSWLDTQRGGASAALRRLVEQARKDLAGEDAARAAQDKTNRLLAAVAGNLPGFEEAIRALYARDKAAFGQHTASWSADLQKVAWEWSADAWNAIRS